MFDYSKLRVRIFEVYGYGGITALAKGMGITKQTLSYKLSGKHPFTVNDILKAQSLLDIDDSDIVKYFFCYKSLPR